MSPSSRPIGCDALAGDGRGDEAVGGVLEQRDLPHTPSKRSASGSLIAPVLVDERPAAEVADPRAAAAQEARERACLGHDVEGRAHRCGRPVRAARRRVACRARRCGARAPVQSRPWVAGAARDEASHRVADQRDLLDLDRPVRRSPSSSSAASAAPFSEMCLPVLKRIEDGCDSEVPRAAARRSWPPDPPPRRTRSRRGRAGRPRAAAWRGPPTRRTAIGIAKKRLVELVAEQPVERRQRHRTAPRLRELLRPRSARAPSLAARC